MHVRRNDLLPTVDHVVVPSRRQKLSISPPCEPTHLGTVTLEFLHFVCLYPDIVVPDRSVPASRRDDRTVPRERGHSSLITQRGIHAHQDQSRFLTETKGGGRGLDEGSRDVQSYFSSAWQYRRPKSRRCRSRSPRPSTIRPTPNSRRSPRVIPSPCPSPRGYAKKSVSLERTMTRRTNHPLSTPSRDSST